MRIHIRRTFVTIVTLVLILLVGYLNVTNESKSLYDHDLEFDTVNHRITQLISHIQWNSTKGISSNVPKKDGVFDLPFVVYHPGSKTSAHLWPHSGGDRIQAQMKHIPYGYSKEDSKAKVIYVHGGLGEPPGQEKFISEKCPVNNCFLTGNKSLASTADAILFQNFGFVDQSFIKQPGQIWILWLLESPLNTVNFEHLGDSINWTATYRRDSTIVTPYEKFVPFPNATSVMSQYSPTNYAKGKHKLVAWFVSNCEPRNQRRELVEELKGYITVDIYGACGTYTCSRGQREKCNQLLNSDYKFYLAFENSNCIDYITEKFYWNALWNDIVPVVLGARKEDYAAVAPPNSFIHIEDFDSVADLANYLLKLDQNDHMYNQYFKWKNSGTFINTKFWCRMCSMLHTVEHDRTVTWYKDIEKWWRSLGVCTVARWDDALHDD